MKKRTSVTGICFLTAGLICTPCLAADVGFGVNINIGNTPSRQYAPPTVYVQAPVVIDSPPMFIAPPSLGLSIAVGIPYDMFLVSGAYYIYKGNQWYYGPKYGGPWEIIPYGKLPRQLHRHDISHYRQVRDREYQSYNRDRDHYRGRYYQAERESDDRHRENGRSAEQSGRNEGRGNHEGRSEGARHGEGRGHAEERGERH